MKLEQLATRLRQLRRHLDVVGAHPATRSTVVERYDRALLDAADMLELPVPALVRGGHALIADEDRTTLEQALAKAGLDVRSPLLPGGAR